jgi:hypothetical protein
MLADMMLIESSEDSENAPPQKSMSLAEQVLTKNKLHSRHTSN